MAKSIEVAVTLSTRESKIAFSKIKIGDVIEKIEKIGKNLHKVTIKPC